MKAKNVISSGVEVMNATQLNGIKGGRIVYLMINGKLVPVEVPD